MNDISEKATLASTLERPAARSDEPAQPKERPNFEVALEQLQATVKKLESGELTLEQSLRQFEEGVRLTRICQEYLAAAEQRVDLLMKGGAEGQVEVQPFTAGRN